MDKRLQKLLDGMDQEEAKFLSSAIQFFCPSVVEEVSSETLSLHFEKVREKINEIERKALGKIEERKLNPICSFCHSRASDVSHMLQANAALNICSECITACYNKLKELE